jgi:hypothetical protein
MEFESSLKNLIVPLPQYRIFRIERPTRSPARDKSCLLGKRDLFSDSLFGPFLKEHKPSKDDLTRASESQEPTRNLSSAEEP